MDYEQCTMPEADSTQAPPKRCRRHDWQPLFRTPDTGRFLRTPSQVLGQSAYGYEWHRYRVCSRCGAFAVFFPYSRITYRLNESQMKAYGTGDGLAADAARWNEYLAQEGGAK